MEFFVMILIFLQEVLKVFLKGLVYFAFAIMLIFTFGGVICSAFVLFSSNIVLGIFLVLLFLFLFCSVIVLTDVVDVLCDKIDCMF